MQMYSVLVVSSFNRYATTFFELAENPDEAQTRAATSAVIAGVLDPQEWTRGDYRSLLVEGAHNDAQMLDWAVQART